MHKILIIEDEKIKIEKLRKYFEQSTVILKESYQGGVSELKNNFNSFNFLILDMTIPLWEKGGNDIGGNYEQFGGERILREMKRRKLFLPTILFTMFDIFPTKEGNITFNQIDDYFKREFNEFYIGAVFYNSVDDDTWKNELSKLILQIKK